MRFLIDAQLPPGLAARLPDDGHDLPAGVHLQRCGAILVSKDEDFADLSRRGVLMVPLLWIRLGNTTNATLWHRLAPLLPEIESAFSAGEKIVEIR